jgi:hypothetical protein
LDQFVEHTLIPASTRGTTRKRNPAYRHLERAKRRAERHGDWNTATTLRKQMAELPSVDPADPDYRRLRYVRYADDFLLGFTGPKAEAEAIRRHLGAFLRDHLKLELSPTKTLITHGRTEAARFLGYDLTVHTANDRRTRRRSDGAATRATAGVIGLRVPADVIRDTCRPYQQHGKARHRTERTNDHVHTIVARYESEYRGVVEYYRLAMNLHRFSRLRWVMEQSLTKTLAAKLRISGKQVRKRYTTRIQTERGPRVALQVSVPREGKPPLVATWGRTTLHRDLSATLTDAPGRPWNARSELVDRLLTECCTCCGAPDQLEVHHIRALKDLRRLGRKEPPLWMQVMAARQRKTLVVCRDCHDHIHAGHPTRPREDHHRVLESRMP